MFVSPTFFIDIKIPLLKKSPAFLIRLPMYFIISRQQGTNAESNLEQRFLRSGIKMGYILVDPKHFSKVL